MIPRSLFVAGLLWTPWVVLAQEAPAPETTEPTPQQLAKVLSFLSSPEASVRRGAYKACRARGDGFKEPYLELLERAENAHGHQLARQIQSSLGPATPIGEVMEAYDDWQSAADLARPFVLTDHHKDPGKFQEMDRLFLDAQKKWAHFERVEKKLAGAGDAMARLDASAAALREIHREKAWCRPDEFDAEDEPSLADLEDELSLGDSVTAFLRARGTLAELRQRIARVTAANATAAWASEPQKGFAALLNSRRIVLGLPPLFLHEKLSKASTGHSQEMIAMGYFSHESPVAEHKTFGQRAAKAGFEGGASGECIFAGGADPASAEKAWWYSDGHRLINYSPGPNVLGIGPVGGHWTLNTGNAPEPPEAR